MGAGKMQHEPREGRAFSRLVSSFLISITVVTLNFTYEPSYSAVEAYQIPVHTSTSVMLTLEKTQPAKRVPPYGRTGVRGTVCLLPVDQPALGSMAFHDSFYRGAYICRC